MKTCNTEKDFVVMVGDNFTRRDFFGKLYISAIKKDPASFETEEDAYIAKNTSDDEEIRQYAKVYEREVTTRMEIA